MEGLHLIEIQNAEIGNRGTFIYRQCSAGCRSGVGDVKHGRHGLEFGEEVLEFEHFILKDGDLFGDEDKLGVAGLGR
jgi:hypothetical protein